MEAPPRGPSLATGVAAGVALAIGIGIGAVVAPMLRPSAPEAGARTTAPRAAVALAPQTTLAPAPQAAAVADLPQARAPAPIPVSASASDATATPAQAAVTPTRPHAKIADAAPCSTAHSRAEHALCADPEIAADDGLMKMAYQRALQSGASPDTLRGDQIAWLLLREEAAGRSRADLAKAYRQRIEQLNSLADEPPH